MSFWPLKFGFLSPEMWHSHQHTWTTTMGYHPRIGLGKLDQFSSKLHHGSILPEKSCPVRCAQRMIQCCNPERRSSPDAPQDVLEETNVWERGSESLSYWSIWTVSVSIAIGQFLQVVMFSWWLVVSRADAPSIWGVQQHPLLFKLFILFRQGEKHSGTQSTVVWNIPIGISRYDGMILKSLRWHCFSHLSKEKS